MLHEVIGENGRLKGLIYASADYNHSLLKPYIALYISRRFFL